MVLLWRGGVFVVWWRWRLCAAVFLWCGGDFVMSLNLLLSGGVFFVVVVSLRCGHVDVWVVFLWCVALSCRVVLFMVWRCLCGVVMLVWCGGAFVVWLCWRVCGAFFGWWDVFWCGACWGSGVL